MSGKRKVTVRWSRPWRQWRVVASVGPFASIGRIRYFDTWDDAIAHATKLANR